MWTGALALGLASSSGCAVDPADQDRPEPGQRADGPELRGTVDEVVREVLRRPSWQVDAATQEGHWVHLAGGIRGRFGRSVTLQDAQEGAWSSELELLAYGRRGAETPVEPPVVDAWGARVTLDRGPVQEWYENVGEGLEQGFTLSAAPSGDGEIAVRMAVRGDLRPLKAGSDLHLVDAAGEERVVVRELRVVDADLRALPARYETSCDAASCELAVVFDDAGARWPVVVDPIYVEPLVTKTAVFTGTEGYAGYAVDVADDFAIVGIPGDPNAINVSGQAMILRRNSGTADAWVQSALLDEAVNSFGYDVAIDGRVAVVGAPVAGNAYVYEFSGASWSLVATLNQPGGRFGHAVDVDGERVVVGEPLSSATGTNAGAAWVYERSVGVGSWSSGVSLVAPYTQANANFGTAVAIDGDLVASTAPGVAFAGRAHVFERIAVNAWEESQRFDLAADPYGQTFGMSVALSGTALAVGAPGAPEFADPDLAHGAVLLWTRLDLRFAASGPTILEAPDTSDDFGRHVAMNDTALAVSAHETLPHGPAARVWMFHRDDLEPIAVVEDAAAAALPLSVALSDSLMVVGRPEGGTLGSVTMHRLAGDLVEDASFTPQDGGGTAVGAQAGAAVAVDDDLLAVGLPLDDTGAADAGQVLLLRRSAAAADGWTYSRTIAPATAVAGAEFGREIAMNDGWLLVGAPSDDRGGADAGAAYLFPVDSGAAVWSSLGAFAAGELGAGIAVSADWMAVGVPGRAEVRVYHLAEAAREPFSMPGGTTISTLGFINEFGRELAVGDRWLVVGSPLSDVAATNGGYVHAYDLASGAPAAEFSVAGSIASGRLGRAVAVSGDVVFVGEPGATSNAGHVRRFAFGGTQFDEVLPSLAPGGAGDELGFALAADGDRLAVGSLSGAVQVLERNLGGASAWGMVAQPAPADGTSGAFGRSLDLQEGTLVVGAQQHTGGDGRVSVFELDTPLPPVAIEDGFAGDEDQVLSGNVLANDFDPNGDAFSGTLIQGPVTGGTFQFQANGNFQWTPPQDFFGQDSFVYEVSAAVSAEVVLDVLPVNDAPVGVPEVHGLVEDGAYASATSLLATATDVEGDPVSVVLVGAPSFGVLTLDTVTGLWSYQPDPDWNGTDGFTWQPFDGYDVGNPVTVTLEVAPVNDAPTGQAWAGETDEDVPLTVLAPGLLANATDVEGDPIQAAIVTPPALGALVVDPVTGAFTFTPSPEAHGADLFEFALDDGTDTTVYQGSLTIHEVNDAPLGVVDAYQVAEDGLLVTVAGVDGVLANDSDVDLPLGEVLTATVLTAPANGSLAFTPEGAFTYTPNLNFNGADPFTYEVCDAPPAGLVTACTAPVQVTITVLGVNDPPVVATWLGVTNEDTLLDVPAPGLLTVATDPDGDVLTVDIVPVANPTSGAAVLSANGHFTYDPDPNFAGTDSFTFRVSDATTSSLGTAQIAVATLNDAPVAVPDAYAVDEDSVLQVVAPGVVFNDTDADDLVAALAVTVLSPPSNGSLTNVGGDGSFDYAPNADFSGVDTLTYEVRDPQGATDIGQVTITVNPVNDAPVGQPDTYASGPAGLDELAATGVLANDGDVDGDVLAAAVDVSPANGLLVLDGDGAFRYTPDVGFVGADVFTYTVTDGAVSVGPITVDLTVSAGTTTDTGDTGLPTGTPAGTATGGTTDTGCTPQTWYPDADGDGYGAVNDAVVDCGEPPGMTQEPGDCDDGDETVYPGAEEFPDDGVDQDCDGQDAVVKAATGCGCATGGSSFGPLGLWLIAVAVARRGKR